MSRSTVPFRLEDVKGSESIILIFAPSDRSPAYENQAQLLQDEEISARTGARLAYVFCDGDSYINNEKMDRASAEQLRAEFDVGDDDFLIVLIGRDGSEKSRDDAPLQSAMILERITDASRPA